MQNSKNLSYLSLSLLILAISISSVHAALPPWAEHERINAQREMAPEELILRVDKAEVTKHRSLIFIGRITHEKHTLNGEILKVARSQAGLKPGDSYTLVVELNRAAINRQKRAHQRKVRRGWVGPNVYFMNAPVFSKGSPSTDHPYQIRVWVEKSNSIIIPAAGPHSFDTPELMGTLIE